MYRVGFDPKAHGGMWVWWQDGEAIRRAHKRDPVYMVREATADEISLMDRLRNVLSPRTAQEIADSKRLMEMLNGAA